MARRRYLSSLRPISDVQLTSFMDLSFLLLVTFIITYPLMEKGVPVNLPRGGGQDLQAEKAHVVSLDREGQVYLDDARVSLAKLGEELAHYRDVNPDVSVRLRADEGIDYGKVMEVVKILHASKISRMALVTLADDKPNP